MGIEYKVEINVPEPDARRIIAEKINEWFGTAYEAKDVQVRYSGHDADDETFAGFYVWDYTKKTRRD
jgi:hypothetical protein